MKPSSKSTLVIEIVIGLKVAEGHVQERWMFLQEFPTGHDWIEDPLVELKGGPLAIRFRGLIAARVC
jgi:hypothetical protein